MNTRSNDCSSSAAAVPPRRRGAGTVGVPGPARAADVMGSAKMGAPAPGDDIGSAKEARAMLERAVAAVQAGEAKTVGNMLEQLHGAVAEEVGAVEGDEAVAIAIVKAAYRLHRG